tara:strand:+ start:205 stop:519 length:315 start_codon:yes stop_codon:yes gene_type:complete
MKSLLLLPLLFGLIRTANADVRYIVNHGRINIEVRCQDGIASHELQHMDEEGDIQTLKLKGDGDEYFKNPELIPSNIWKSENGILCSSRQLTKKEIEAYDKKFK